MATVKNRSRAGGKPVGDVTFWDGATMLGTAPLRHGKAKLKTSSLPLGRDKIQAQYAGNQIRQIFGQQPGPKTRRRRAMQPHCRACRQEGVHSLAEQHVLAQEK